MGMPQRTPDPEVTMPAEWDADRLTKKSSAATLTPSNTRIMPDIDAVVEHQPEKPVFTFAHRRSGDSEEEFDRKMDVFRVRGNTAETVDSGQLDINAEKTMAHKGSVVFRVEGDAGRNPQNGGCDAFPC